jgi:hypothetical protein
LQWEIEAKIAVGAQNNDSKSNRHQTGHAFACITEAEFPRSKIRNAGHDALVDNETEDGKGEEELQS